FEVPYATTTDVRLGDSFHADRRLQARLTAETFQGLLKSEAVEDGRQHAHVVSGSLLDHLAGAGERRPTQNVASSNDDGQLYPPTADPLVLVGDVERLVNADARLAWIAEALAAELQDDAAILRCGSGGLLVHDVFLCACRNHFPGLYRRLTPKASERHPAKDERRDHFRPR